MKIIFKVPYNQLLEIEKQNIISHIPLPDIQSKWFNDVFQYNKTFDNFYINIGNANQWKQKLDNALFSHLTEKLNIQINS